MEREWRGEGKEKKGREWGGRDERREAGRMSQAGGNIPKMLRASMRRSWWGIENK